MKVRPFRIPKQFALPGIVVNIKTIPRDSEELGGDDGGWAYDVPDGDGPAATIYIAPGLTLPEQRYTLIHEGGHVWWDYLHMALKFYPELVKVC